MKVLVYFWENTQPVRSYLMLLELLMCSVGLNKVASMVPSSLIILKVCKDFSAIGMGMNMSILLLVEMKLVAMNIIHLFERKTSYKFKTEANISFSSNLPKSAHG